MKFMHLADLHIGKKVNGFSMLEDQRYVLGQVLEVAAQQQLDGVILAGDIYDKTVPSGEAVQMLDWFLTELTKRNLPVYMVSGNHDSGERLAFGAKLFAKSGVHVASLYDGTLEKIVLEDEYGTLNLYLLPFVKPVHVRSALKEDVNIETMNGGRGEAALGECFDEREEFATGEIKTYDDALRRVLVEAEIDSSARNLLVAHQLVTGAVRCDSEDVSVGGIDNVNAGLFEDFDYVALGHIHGAQSMTRETIRYAGTLLKYSFSECSHRKSITIVEMREKNDVLIETIFVNTLRDMRIIKGDYASLMSKSFYENSNCEDYIKVILTDEREIPEVMGKMRTVYPNIMTLEYDNIRKRNETGVQYKENVEQKQPMEHFKDFYFQQNGVGLNEQQEKLVFDMMKEIWGE